MKKLLLAAALILAMPLFACKIGNLTTEPPADAGKTFEEAYGQNNSTNPPESNDAGGWFGGIVREGRFYHDGQEEWITYYYADVGEAQLETLKSKLADYEDLGEDPETEIHLYSTNGISLKDCVGKEIRFKGDYFACHTIHHRRNIVFEIKEMEINGTYGAAADADAPSPAALKTLKTPFEPAFVGFDAPCWFNGHEIDGQNFAWDEFEDGSGECCLMILVDCAAWDGAANDMLYLPGFGPPVVRQNENSIYLEWAYRSSGEGINLIFSDGSDDMKVASNELKGANYADTIKLPVSARKNGGSDSGQYYIPLYAILNEIGGEAAHGIFGGETAYIYSGDPIQGQIGFWESGDQGEYHKDAVIGETTHSIASYWNGLEFRPDGTFTFSDRYYQDGGDWVLAETIGRYVFFGRLLIMSYEEESEWRGPDYTVLVPVKTGDSSNKYICCRYVEQWDGDYLDMRGYRYRMYGENLMQNAASPKPGKSAG